jgi:tetratricopeptide (TPR) repeat protein
LKTTLRLEAVKIPEDRAASIAFFTAFIWAVHPLQIQSVTYIVQRENSLASLFCILALLLYSKGRLAEKKRTQWELFLGAILSGLLAIGSKEIAVTLPLFIFLYEWYFFQDLRWDWLKRRLIWLGAILLLGVFIVYLYFLGANPIEKIMSGYDDFNFSMSQRVLTEFRVVVYYLTRLIYPHPSRLNLDHEFGVSRSLFDPLSTFLCLLFIIGCISLAVLVARRQRMVSFSILWFFGNLVIESSVIPLELVYEHRNYLPSMMVCLLFVVLIHWILKRETFAAVVLAGIVALFSFWTFERNEVWRSDLTLWSDAARKSPNKVRPHNNLGLALARIGDHEQAMACYEKAVRINPNLPQAYNNMGLSFSAMEQPDQAIADFSKALEVDPDFVPAHNNLGKELRKQGKIDEAIRHYREALNISPDSDEVHNNLGVALAVHGNLREAIDHFKKARDLNPGHLGALHNLQKAQGLEQDKP